jgi:hypothetical protein
MEELWQQSNNIFWYKKLIRMGSSYLFRLHLRKHFRMKQILFTITLLFIFNKMNAQYQIGLKLASLQFLELAQNETTKILFTNEISFARTFKTKHQILFFGNYSKLDFLDDAGNNCRDCYSGELQFEQKGFGLQYLHNNSFKQTSFIYGLVYGYQNHHYIGTYGGGISGGGVSGSLFTFNTSYSNLYLSPIIGVQTNIEKHFFAKATMQINFITHTLSTTNNYKPRGGFNEFIGLQIGYKW